MSVIACSFIRHCERLFFFSLRYQRSVFLFPAIPFVIDHTLKIITGIRQYACTAISVESMGSVARNSPWQSRSVRSRIVIPT